MKMAAVALALAAAAAPLSAQAAPRTAMTLSGAKLADLQAVREAVWVDWFSGDTASLRKVLGPELVAISAGVPHWQSLEQSLATSADFKANGGKFVSVAFDSTLTHRFGETVVMFSHYAVTMESGGQRQTQKGKPPRCSSALTDDGCIPRGTSTRRPRSTSHEDATLERAACQLAHLSAFLVTTDAAPHRRADAERTPKCATEVAQVLESGTEARFADTPAGIEQLRGRRQPASHDVCMRRHSHVAAKRSREPSTVSPTSRARSAMLRRAAGSISMARHVATTASRAMPRAA